MIQIEAGQEHNQWFFWLHNDWLQILFELGIVGLMAFIFMWLNIVLKSGKYLPAVLAYSACMLTNFPLHLPIHSLLGLLLIGVIYKCES